MIFALQICECVKEVGRVPGSFCLEEEEKERGRFSKESSFAFRVGGRKERLRNEVGSRGRGELSEKTNMQRTLVL